jgi:hypothetical protein
MTSPSVVATAADEGGGVVAGPGGKGNRMLVVPAR